MEIIRFYYSDIINNFTIKFVPIGGKFNYNNQNTINKISEYLKIEKNSKIVFFFDKDQHSSSSEDSKFVQDVTLYCKRNKYALIWFVKDVENVLISRSSSTKTKDANRFRRTRAIKEVLESKLRNPNPQNNGTSNILCVLDKVLRDGR